MSDLTIDQHLYILCVCNESSKLKRLLSILLKVQMSEPETIEDCVFNYHTWLKQVGNADSYFTNSINYDKWSLGMYTRCYNWSVYNQHMGSNTWQPLRQGLASLTLTWNRPLSKEVTLIQVVVCSGSKCWSGVFSLRQVGLFGIILPIFIQFGHFLVFIK